MTDRNFFEKALGLKKPWRVVEVRMEVGNRRVEVEIAVEEGTVWGEQGQRCPVVGYEERRWRHLDTMQFETVLKARVPRIRRSDGSTEMVKVPWAEKSARWTLAFEGWAVVVMQSCGSLNEACKLLKIDWRAGERIMKRAVDRGLERREVESIKRLGIDEKSFRKRHRYGTLVSDMDRGRVWEVVQERTTQAATEALRSLGGEVLEGVEVVAMDMSAAYEAAVRSCCPNAEIAYDKFHAVALLGQAVDRTRRAEHKRLMKQGDQSLRGTRYDWLFDPANMEEERYLEFEQLVARDLKTSRAWHHRQLFSEFWCQRDLKSAERFFGRWYGRTVRSKLPEVVAVAKTLKAHLGGLLNAIKHRITNALSESFNSRIQSLKNAARGFHRFDAFRTRILFHLGGLDLQPR